MEATEERLGASVSYCNACGFTLPDCLSCPECGSAEAWVDEYEVLRRKWLALQNAAEEMHTAFEYAPKKLRDVITQSDRMNDALTELVKAYIQRD